MTGLAPPMAAPVSGAATARTRLGAGERLLHAGFAAACAALLLAAAWLEPAPAGHGTHEQMGLPACAWPAIFGIPCPTCGMTTAFAHAAHGDLPASLRAQPFGLLGAIATAAGFWAGVYGALTGSRISRLFGGMLRPRVLWGIAALWAASWLYKMAAWTP